MRHGAGQREAAPSFSAARGRVFQSLASPNYRRLWLGQVGSSAAEWMDTVTRGWLVYQLTDSALLLGVATALRSAPLRPELRRP